jgi:hypothetical protein
MQRSLFPAVRESVSARLEGQLTFSALPNAGVTHFPGYTKDRYDQPY